MPHTRAQAGCVQTVRTCPCPRCSSRKTQATIVEDKAVWRICLTCGWEWDRDPAYGDKEDLLSVFERIRLIETGSIAKKGRS